VIPVENTDALGTSIQGTGAQATSIQGTGLQATSIQGTGKQAAATSIQGTGVQATSIQGTGLQATSIQGTGFLATSIQGTGKEAAATKRSYRVSRPRGLSANRAQRECTREGMLPPETSALNDTSTGRQKFLGALFARGQRPSGASKRVRPGSGTLPSSFSSEAFLAFALGAGDWSLQ